MDEARGLTDGLFSAPALSEPCFLVLVGYTLATAERSRRSSFPLVGARSATNEHTGSG
jgi:hypothetical protein